MNFVTALSMLRWEGCAIRRVGWSTWYEAYCYGSLGEPQLSAAPDRVGAVIFVPKLADLFGETEWEVRLEPSKTPTGYHSLVSREMAERALSIAFYCHTEDDAVRHGLISLGITPEPATGGI